MARPGLIIGLGGTGQWVLTYIKKELIEYANGTELPPQVKLIAFDTARPLDEQERSSEEEDPIVVEGVQLESGEFYHLGGNIERIVRSIVNEESHSHIGSWLQARTYLTRLVPGQYILEEGAGQMRPFGRMAVFKDLEANPETSRLFGALSDSISTIRGDVREDRSLEISIIASLAGGTGAGMAADVAHIVRTIAEDRIRGGENFVIRGFFVLPRAFHGIPGGDSQAMRARAYAAVRELGRFLTVFGDRSYPMVYNTHAAFKEIFQKPVTKRLFDLCYLVDAHRKHNPLDDVEARYGVFPSIADAILAFLDERSGQVHVEHVKNVGKELVRGDDVANYSALGTYSFILPIHDIAEENACRLSIDFLKRFLKSTDDDEGRVTGLSSTENEEAAGKRGADLAESFLTDPGSVEGIRGTLFLPEVARVVAGGHVRNETLLDQAANRSNTDWLQVIEPDEITEETRELRLQVRNVLEHGLRKDVKSSREQGTKPIDDVERIEREVQQYRHEFLGRELADGTTSGGKFREALDKYEQLQVEKFRKGLIDFSVASLNGSSETEPMLAKSGKLGFVQEFLSVLSQRLDTYCQFCDKVREERGKQGRLQLQRSQVQEARNQMYQDRKKAGWFNKAAFAAQEQYLDQAADQIELEKDEMLFEYVCRIARSLRDQSIALRDGLNEWAIMLATGSHEVTSVLATLRDAGEKVRARRARTNNFERVQHLETEEQYEQKLYDRFAEQQLQNLFQSIKWKPAKSLMSIDLDILGQPLILRKERERDRPTERNSRILLDEARRSFQSLAKSESIGKRLQSLHAPGDLAKKFFTNGSPLMSEREKAVHGQSANFLAVKYGESEGDQQYFEDVVAGLSSRSGAKGQRAQLVQSTGSHKCTLIYTKDVLNFESMSAYDELSKAYQDFEDDRRLLHNFPAEVNAVYYEQRLNKLQKPYRRFSPRIVFLLEHKDWVRQYTRCLVHSLIQIERDEDRNPYYVLQLPECEFKDQRFPELEVRLSPPVAQRPDLNQALNTFVFRRNDVRKELEIPIVYDHVAGALIHCERQVGDEGANIEKIEAAIKGFVADFQKPKKGKAQYEIDLGDLMNLMLLDEIDRLSVR